jgi:Holliday junction resolvase RusA-like endonuclease
MIDWGFSENCGWRQIHHFRIMDFPPPKAETTKPYRDHVRSRAASDWPDSIPTSGFWGFRVIVRRKYKGQAADLDNYIKGVIDSFSGSTLKRDESKYAYQLKLYPDDSVKHVRLVEVAAEESQDLEMEVWIYNNSGEQSK